ncbi:MAG: hypothetical protein HQL63_03905 [Magnetococcales bacterium]|nr:hypothetical protein [Magnetococcales bacterium]
MTENSQDDITRIVALIRDNKVEDARQLLDQASEQSPESVARWYLFARLLVSSLGEKEIEERLSSFGRAPGQAFRTALAALQRALPSEVPAPDHPELLRLKKFLDRLQGVPPEPLPAPVALARLEDFLRRVQTRRAAVASSVGPVETQPPTWITHGLRPFLPVTTLLASVMAHGHDLKRREIDRI